MYFCVHLSPIHQTKLLFMNSGRRCRDVGKIWGLLWHHVACSFGTIHFGISWPLKMGEYVVSKRRQGITTIRCGISQNSADLSIAFFFKFLRFSRLSFWLRSVLRLKWVWRISGVIQEYRFTEKRLPGPNFASWNSHGLSRNWKEAFLYIKLRTWRTLLLPPSPHLEEWENWIFNVEIPFCWKLSD